MEVGTDEHPIATGPRFTQTVSIAAFILSPAIDVSTEGRIILGAAVPRHREVGKRQCPRVGGILVISAQITIPTRVAIARDGYSRDRPIADPASLYAIVAKAVDVQVLQRDVT